MVDLKQYIPNIYNEILDMDILISTEEKLFEKVKENINKIKNNQFVLTSDLDGIRIYESMLGITATNTENIEFRRKRVINRLSMTPPYTLNFLKEKLDELIGVGNWILTLDYDNYIMYIESSAFNQNWYQEIRVTLTKVKPANIVFINKPLVTDEIFCKEEIKQVQAVYNYHLDKWELGYKAFLEYIDKGVVKMSNEPSVQADLLNKLADFTATDIVKIRLNEDPKFIINNFDVKTSIDNMVNIEYKVYDNTGIQEIYSIELLDFNDKVLSKSLVYIPVEDFIILKHTIKITEGILND